MSISAFCMACTLHRRLYVHIYVVRLLCAVIWHQHSSQSQRFSLFTCALEKRAAISIVEVFVCLPQSLQSNRLHLLRLLCKFALSSCTWGNCFPGSRKKLKVPSREYWVFCNPEGAHFSLRILQANIKYPICFQRRPGSYFLCQHKRACANHQPTYNRHIGSQVHCLLRLRVISLTSDLTWCRGPGPVNTTTPYWMLFCWLFQNTRLAWTHPSVRRVRVYRCASCVLRFPWSINQLLHRGQISVDLSSK